MQKKVSIKIEELPVRTEKLSKPELEKVFGGCAEVNGYCKNYNDCCPGLVCEVISNRCC